MKKKYNIELTPTSFSRQVKGYQKVNKIFKVHRIRITKNNIDKFQKRDRRVGSERFAKERKWLEKEIADFVKNGNKNYPERYDLTVFTFDHNKKSWFLIDGSHRIEALKELFERKKIEGLDAILIPDALIPTNLNKTWEQLSKQQELLNKMLKKEGLPIWIKKYGIAQLKNGQWIGWVNIKAINSGGKDMTMMSIPEYRKTREQQPL